MSKKLEDQTLTEKTLADQVKREIEITTHLRSELEYERKQRYKLQSDKDNLIEILLDTKRSDHQRNKYSDLPF